MHQTGSAVCLLAGRAVAGSSATGVQGKPLQAATIVNIGKHEADGGDNPSEALRQAALSIYDVAIRTGCLTYIARYGSAYDYSPGGLAINRRLPTRVGKDDIAFDLVDPQMQLPIAHSRKDGSANCQ